LRETEEVDGGVEEGRLELGLEIDFSSARKDVSTVSRGRSKRRVELERN